MSHKKANVYHLHISIVLHSKGIELVTSYSQSRLQHWALETVTNSLNKSDGTAVCNHCSNKIAAKPCSSLLPLHEKKFSLLHGVSGYLLGSSLVTLLATLFSFHLAFFAILGLLPFSVEKTTNVSTWTNDSYPTYNFIQSVRKWSVGIYR